MDELAQEILNLVKIKMIEQAAFDRDAYNDLIEETIQDFRTNGKMTDDDNDEFIVAELMDIWEEVEEEMAEHRKNI